MTKQVVHVSGEDVVVREDTAKAYRGVYWALLSVAAFILIAALMFMSGFFARLAGPTSNAPAVDSSQNSAVR
jgi:hypothetical protein